MLGNAESGGVEATADPSNANETQRAEGTGSQRRRRSGLGHRWAADIPSNLGQVSDVSLILTFHINGRKRKKKKIGR